MDSSLFTGREKWLNANGQWDGTYVGSQLGNTVRTSFQAGTGLGGSQAVLFDFELGKFKVNINPGLGKKNFQIIGKDAAELKRDLDYKAGVVLHTNAKNSLLGRMSKGLSSAIKTATVPSPYQPMPVQAQAQAPVYQPAPAYQQRYGGKKNTRRARRASRGTRRH